MTRTLQSLPKAHLHLHFTGSMRFATLTDLADKHGVRLPAGLSSGWPPKLSIADERGWFRFQRLYDAARACVRDESDLRRLVREAAADDAAEGSGWLELQIDPTSYAAGLGGITPALEVVLDEAAIVSATGPTKVGIVVAASRTRHPFDARALARLASRYAGVGPGQVVGFGLSNDERRGDTAEFHRAFDIAHAAGLAAVPHGGELLGPGHLDEIAEHLRPHRLGHGVRAVEDPALLARLVEQGVTFEVCPTSNVALGVYPDLASVPVAELLAAGAQVALGADDPLLFGPRLLAQYESARTDQGLGDEQLAILARGSVRGSLAPEATKVELLATIDRWLAAPE